LVTVPSFQEKQFREYEDMRERLITFILLSLLVVSGCEENEYTIHMRYDGDGVIRKVVCSANMPPGIHAKLQKLYSRQVDANSYEGSFGENLLEDVGGFGRNLHLSNPMGDAYIYVERFRGDDAQALDIEKAFDASDHLVDLVIDWLEFELGSNANFERLKAFCNAELREDVKNLVVYMWMVNRIHDSQEKDLAARMLLYLYEREYFTITDISNIAASTDQEAWILSYVRRLIAKKLGYSNAEEAGKELAFLQDQNTVQQSASRFLASPKMYKRVLQAARAKSGDPNLVISPKLFDDFNDIGEEMFEGYGIELETLFIRFDIFGGSPDKVNVKLDCPRKPFETNGEWDEATRQVSWSSRITDEKLPFMCYATIGEPNAEFQKKHFGRVILEDEELVEYSFCYKVLKEDQSGEWDEFLVSLDPNQEVESRVESFRFQNAPPPSPDSDGEVKLLSDLPRNLIVEGLKMKKKDQQESDSQKSAQAQQQSFRVHSIGRVVKKDGRTFLELDKRYEAGLKGLEKHSYVDVVYWFDKNDTPEKRAILEVHPGGDEKNPLTGVFATHSPFRPNLIAISKCDIISIKENVIEIKEIDAFDGSPVLDLKGDFFGFYKPNTK